MPTLKQLQKHPKVLKIVDEGEVDGYWAELKKGWVCESSGYHSCHEDTLEALAEAIDGAQECDCEECA